MNERYLNWDAAARTQLLKLACAENLEIVSSHGIGLSYIYLLYIYRISLSSSEASWSLPLLTSALHCRQFRHFASAQDNATVEGKLEELLALVPDLAEKLGRMKADMLTRLLSDTEVCSMDKLKICAVSTASSNGGACSPASLHVPTLQRHVLCVQRLAERLSQLRGLLPGTDVSMLVSKLPAIVLEHEAEELAARLTILK